MPTEWKQCAQGTKEDITLIISSSNSVKDFLFLVVNKYIKYILCLKKKSVKSKVKLHGFWMAIIIEAHWGVHPSG